VGLVAGQNGRDGPRAGEATGQRDGAEELGHWEEERKGEEGAPTGGSGRQTKWKGARTRASTRASELRR